MGESITPLKLQKLLYYIQGWHLAYFDHSLFKDEPEAWVNGPVYMKVYNLYKDRYRQEPIMLTSTEEEKVSDKMDEELKALNLSNDQQEYLYQVLSTYGKVSDIKLVYLTHSEAPWLNARKDLKPFESSRTNITHDSMKAYFKSKI